MAQRFFDFLENIGIIDPEDSNVMKQVYKKSHNVKNKNNFCDLFFTTLMYYFDNLSLDQKKYISFTLPIRYKTNLYKLQNEKLKSIIMKQNLKNKMLKLKAFFKWKLLNFKYKKQAQISVMNYTKKTNFNRKSNVDKSNSTNSNSEKMSFDEYLKTKKLLEENSINNNYIYNYSINKCIKNSDANSSKNRNRRNSKSSFNLSTRDRKYIQELKECTFSPKINESISKPKIDEFQSTFNKLYNDAEKLRIKKLIKELEFDKKRNQEYVFSPNLNRQKKYISQEKFETRQRNFSSKKRQNSNLLKSQLEANTENLCSFQPTINKFKMNTEKYLLPQDNENHLDQTYCTSYSTKTLPVYIRLYDDNKRRINKNKKKMQDYEKYIETLAKSQDKKIPIVNYSKLNELCDIKEKNKIQLKTKEKVEREEGITFKPEIKQNKEYIDRIFSNFYERNASNNNCKNCDHRIMENDGFKNKKNNKKCNYTESQKRVIVQNIIDRLYNEPMSTKSGKFSESGCNKFTKSFINITSEGNASNFNNFIMSNDGNIIRNEESREDEY